MTSTCHPVADFTHAVNASALRASRSALVATTRTLSTTRSCVAFWNRLRDVYKRQLILHGTRSAHRLPKEIAVGLFFSAAIFIPTIARRPGLHLPLLPSAALFAALCSLNCLFICAWEHADGKLVASTGQLPYTRPTHATTHFALAHLSVLAVGVAIVGAAFAILGSLSLAYVDEPPVPTACASVSYTHLDVYKRQVPLPGPFFAPSLAHATAHPGWITPKWNGV